MKSINKKILEFENDSLRVGFIESNFNSVLDFVNNNDLNEESFKTIVLLMRSLYNKSKFEFIVVLFSNIDFNKTFHFNGNQEFVSYWIRSFYQKKKMKKIAENYDCLKQVDLLDIELYNILEYSKREMSFPPLYRFIRGAEVLFIGFFLLLILMGFREMSFVIFTTSFILIIQGFRFFMFRENDKVRGSWVNTLVQLLVFILITLMFSFYKDMPWVVLLLYPFILIFSLWFSDAESARRLV